MYLYAEMKQLLVKDTISKLFPDFNKSKEFIDELLQVGSIVELEAGVKVVDAGEYIKTIPFLMDGLIKIYREDDFGNEILLYYINSGESCVISITASLKDEKSSIKAIVEEDSKLLGVPTREFVNLLSKYNLLHTFTYDLFNIKYNELIKSIDSLAFSNMGTRLMQYLVNEANLKNSKQISGLTHKGIAKDLSTSREVISRQLNALQKDGKIAIKNKIITLMD